MKLFQTPILLFGLLLAGCKEEYEPQLQSSEQSILVVEGVLNSGFTSTTIQLTRTFKLDDSAQLRPELGAEVRVESEDGAMMPLYDALGDGHYINYQLGLDAAEKYRLYIRTSDGEEYATNFMPVLQNPAIDSISWKRNEDGVTVFANTHNPQNNTRYYRWEYEETWMITSSYYALYKMVNDYPVERQMPEEQVYYCWRYFNSSELLLASTAKLAQDVVYEKKLLHIPARTERLGERYSVLVRQYALTKEAYDFYQLMKKNTESLGSIFDAQPSEIAGNVRSLSDGGKKTIGYITIAPVQQQRIFISKDEVPQWGFSRYCADPISVPTHPDSVRKYFIIEYYLPYDVERRGLTIVAYKGALRDCVDCTVRGGSTERPWYW